MKKILLPLIFLGLLSGKVYASNGENYGGGVYHHDTSFRVEKQVKVGNSPFMDTVTAGSNDTVTFRIKITNTSDKGDVNNVNYKDYLPKGLVFVSGTLTSHFNTFKDKETKIFTVVANIDPSEFKGTNFRRCLVNRAEVSFGSKYTVSDTATVCFEKKEPKPEPKKVTYTPNTFNKDKRCLDSRPQAPQWINKVPTIFGVRLSWSAIGGDKVDIAITNYLGVYEYHYDNVPNTGHFLLPNVSMNQLISVRVVNGCKSGPWLAI